MKIVYEFGPGDHRPEVLNEIPTPWVAYLHLRRKQNIIDLLEKQLVMEKMSLLSYERQLVKAQELEEENKARIGKALKAIRERTE